MRRTLCALCGAFFAFTAIVGLADSASAQQDFYKGKTVKVIVPLPTGGTYDIMARFVAQHMGKHIPGKPNVLVENRPGGAYLTGARAAMMAEPDGLTLFHFPSTAIYNQLLGQTNDVDFSAFEWVGSAGGAYYTLVLRTAIAFDKFEDLKTRQEPLNIGVLSPDSVVAATAKIARDMAGLNLKLISGYAGVNDIELATRRGELDGYATADVTFQSSAITREALENKVLGPVAIYGGSGPAKDWIAAYEKLPKLRDHIKPGIDQQAFDAFIGTFQITRPFVATPKTPADRMAVLRKAFLDTLKDPEFLAMADKAGFAVDAIGGEETGKLLGSIFGMPDAVKNRVKGLLQ